VLPVIIYYYYYCAYSAVAIALLCSGNELVKKLVEDGWLYKQSTGTETDFTLVDEAWPVH